MGKLKEYGPLLAVVLLVLWYLGRRANDAVEAVGTAVNPASDRNLAYRFVNWLPDYFDDGKDNDSFSLGSRIYDLIHGRQEAEKLRESYLTPQITPYIYGDIEIK